MSFKPGAERPREW